MLCQNQYVRVVLYVIRFSSKVLILEDDRIYKLIAYTGIVYTNSCKLSQAAYTQRSRYMLFYEFMFFNIQSIVGPFILLKVTL